MCVCVCMCLQAPNDGHTLQRGGSLSQRRAQSDSLQSRLPITQHFGMVRWKLRLVRFRHRRVFHLFVSSLSLVLDDPLTNPLGQETALRPETSVTGEMNGRSRRRCLFCSNCHLCALGLRLEPSRLTLTSRRWPKKKGTIHFYVTQRRWIFWGRSLTLSAPAASTIAACCTEHAA